MDCVLLFVGGTRLESQDLRLTRAAHARGHVFAGITSCNLTRDRKVYVHAHHAMNISGSRRRNVRNLIVCTVPAPIDTSFEHQSTQFVATSSFFNVSTNNRYSKSTSGVSEKFDRWIVQRPISFSPNKNRTIYFNFIDNLSRIPRSWHALRSARIFRAMSR